MQEYKKRWYEEHKKECLERSKKHYVDNREDKLNYQKQYVLENPDKVFNKCQKRRLREENQGNGITKEQWLEMMNFFEWKCAYSGITLTNDTRSLDHIIAISKGGLNEIWNMCPMLKSYNSSKNTSDMLEWYIKQSYFSEERLNKIYEWIEYAKKKWCQ